MRNKLLAHSSAKLPDRFGIYSPPVASLLGLIPSDEPVKTYLSYREVLRKVGMLHQVERIAHVDMALWAAARESTTESHKILRSRMHGDARFRASSCRTSAKG